MYITYIPNTDINVYEQVFPVVDDHFHVRKLSKWNTDDAFSHKINVCLCEQTKSIFPQQITFDSTNK